MFIRRNVMWCVGESVWEGLAYWLKSKTKLILDGVMEWFEEFGIRSAGEILGMIR